MPHDEWENYNKDPRTKCKYGGKCYQKNPEHHKTYKHPPHASKAVKDVRGNRRFSPFNRKPKDLEAKPNVTPQDKEKDQENHVKHKLSTDECEPNKTEDYEHPSTSSNTINNLLDTGDCKINLPENLKYYDINEDQEIFKELFLVEMPPDFYKFFKCLNKDGTIVKLLASVNLELIGPYDLFLGKLPILEDKDLYLIHWRFFYDPPEFQAVLKKKGSSQFHFGYYRDSPAEQPVFVASNDSEKDYRITPVANNIFGAVYLYLQNEKKKSPFTAMACQKIMDTIKKIADEEKFSLQEYNTKKRQAQAVAKTLHGAGIVVPYNKKTQLGYRFLVETDANLKKIFARLKEATTQAEKDKVLSELQPVITYASIAVDECDFGTGLEAGIDLFCSGLRELHPSILSSLTSVYSLLNRDAFGKIVATHLKYRRQGSNLSILDCK